MFGAVDWTAVIVASIGLATAIVSAVVTVRVKVIEARAAADARQSAKSASEAKASADSVRIKPNKRPKKPDHPCDT